jgi:hypothetical protein
MSESQSSGTNSDRVRLIAIDDLWKMVDDLEKRCKTVGIVVEEESWGAVLNRSQSWFVFSSLLE